MKHSEKTNSSTELTSYVLYSTQLRLERFKLLVSTPQDGKMVERLYEFDDAPVRLGTLETDVDIVLEDSTVSRRHCEIIRSGDRFILNDLNSTNGTFINDVRIRQVYLDPGQEFQIGQVKIVFNRADQPVQITPTHKHQLGKVIGADVKMREIFSIIEKISHTDTTVIIEGETGTGKDVVAQSIHEHSRRAGKPFVVVDCSAIPEHLIESELFGHEKGSFTGAIMARKGLFEQAEGGTIFLDELGELSLELQPKLLRVLESREVRRVGGTKSTPINVRVIAATNRDLENEVSEGRFREDLFYRLSVVRIFLPPLRERIGDLPLLFTHFIKKVEANQFSEGQVKLNAITREALQMMMGHQWPGNVRELLNTIERACTFAEKGLIQPSDLPKTVQNSIQNSHTYSQVFISDKPVYTLQDLAEFTPVLPTPPLNEAPSLPRHLNSTTLPLDSNVLSMVFSDSLPDEDDQVENASDTFESFKIAKERWIALFEKDYILAALKRSNYNISHASREAEIDRKYFRKLMQKYEIEIP